MQITNEQYNRIQDYLDGRMAESERQQFIADSSADSVLQEHLAFETQLREDMQDMFEKKEIFSLYQQMEVAEAGNAGAGMPPVTDVKTGAEKQQPGGKVFAMKPWMMAAAACVAIALIGLFYLLGPSGGNGNDDLKNRLASLYNDNFVKDTLPKANYPLLAKAFSDYERNDYSTLQQYDLQNLPNIKGVEDQQKQTVLEFGYYYKGISYLQTKDFEKANTSFQWVLDNAVKEDLKWKAAWYMGLSYIQLANTGKAIQLLQQVAANDKAGGYKTKAAALLEKLQTTVAKPK